MARVTRSQVGGVRVFFGRLQLLWERGDGDRPFIERHRCPRCFNLYVGALGVEWIRRP